MWKSLSQRVTTMLSQLVLGSVQCSTRCHCVTTTNKLGVGLFNTAHTSCGFDCYTFQSILFPWIFSAGLWLLDLRKYHCDHNLPKIN